MQSEMKEELSENALHEADSHRYIKIGTYIQTYVFSYIVTNFLYGFVGAAEIVNWSRQDMYVDRCGRTVPSKAFDP